VLHAATAGEEPITHKDNTPERFIVDQLKSTFQGESIEPEHGR
jgi:hypothetical protein